MTTSNHYRFDYREIAKTVIKRAVEIDQRVQIPNSARIDAWATVFDGQVWPREAEDAVAVHYRDPRAFPLMPGDVVDYCERQPVWSSVEHATDWILRIGVRNPYSGAIEAYSGILEPVIDIPDSVPRAEHRAYLVEKLTEWASGRLDELAAAIVARRFDPSRGAA